MWRWSFVVVLFMLIIHFNGNAQNRSVTHSSEFGLGVGGLSYTGDLSPSLSLSNSGLAGEVFYRYNFANDMSVLRANLLMGQLKGNEENRDDPLSKSRNLSFSTVVTEFSILYEYNFLDFRKLYSKNDYYMTPYLLGGLIIGVGSMGSAATYTGIPFGVGVKFRMTQNINIGLEFCAKKVFSDKLDGYDDDIALSSSSQQDWYYFTGIMLSWTGYRVNCPKGHP